MRSKLADALRQEQRDADRARTPLARLRLARRLGDDAVLAFANAYSLTLEQAAAELSRRKQLGRRPSACARGR